MLLAKKVNPQLLTSIIWEKDYSYRVVYVTLLLLKDESTDIANCTFDSLRRYANVSEHELSEILKSFENTVIHTPDGALGSLVKKVEDGYKLLDIYKDNPKEKKEKNKHYMRQYRATKKAQQKGIEAPERKTQIEQVDDSKNGFNFKKKRVAK